MLGSRPSQLCVRQFYALWLVRSSWVAVGLAVDAPVIVPRSPVVGFLYHEPHNPPVEKHSLRPFF